MVGILVSFLELACFQGRSFRVVHSWVHAILLMEEIPNNHLGCTKPSKWWDKLPNGPETGAAFYRFWRSSLVLNTWKRCVYSVFCWLICRFYWFMCALLLRVARNDCFTTKTSEYFYLLLPEKSVTFFSGVWKHKRGKTLIFCNSQ